MELDHAGLEILSRDECLALLGSVPIGRVGLSLSALPVVLPVNFAVCDDSVIVRTSEGSKFSAAITNAVVALEADHYDSLGHNGWSVLVQGSSRVVSDVAELERVRRLPLRPWANPDTDRFISISTDVVSGRRVRGWYRPDGHEAFLRVATR
jgi:nitroimidazol reductase NimA-like FMN-containing flavoprotein (pyridoxamine 5'-phosphate oxidase superfamily)